MAQAGSADFPYLCPDVLVSILKCLTQQERFHHAALVCKLLCKAAYQATAHVSISLAGATAASPSSNLEHFRAWLDRGGASYIQALLIKSARTASWCLHPPQPQLQLPWTRLTALRSLSLYNVVLQPTDLRQHLGHLSNLTLHRVDNIGSLLPCLPWGLQRLAVYANGQLSASVQQHGWGCVGRLGHLTSLLLDRCGVTDTGMLQLSRLSQLQRLVSWHNTLVNPWQHIAQLTSLTHLDILSTELLLVAGNSNRCWSRLCNLHELRLGSSVVVEECAPTCRLTLPATLTKLEACGWRFTAAIAAEDLLLGVLPQLQRLQQLKLLCCEFPVGVSAGAFSGLGQLAGLTSLNMSGCMVPHGACSSKGLFKPGALPQLQELLLHGLTYTPFVTGSNTAAMQEDVPGSSGSCLAGLTACCPGLQRLDIRGMLAVEAGGIAALTKLKHLTSIDVDMQWYSMLDEAVAAALEQLRRKVPPTVMPAEKTAVVVPTEAPVAEG